MSRDLGDFQTPPALVSAVLRRLGDDGPGWARVLEPTVGRGHFLAALLAQARPPREVLGVEVQEGHLAEARAVARGAGETRVGLTHASLFDLHLGRDLRWETAGPLLVVGNPPWVTNSALGVLGSGNGPRKVNGRRARGIDALTGASNFDLAEAVWLKVLTDLATEAPTVALLCKTQVARNVLAHAARLGLPVADAWLARVDARRWFGASVEACLFCLTLSATPAAFPARVPVFADLDATAPASALGFARGGLVADINAYEAVRFADGACALTWRQGLKHDAAGVMELAPDPANPGAFRNKQGDPADVEPARAFPLLKGTDLARPGPPVPRRSVVVTQAKVGECTAGLEGSSPRLWAYLRRHEAKLAGRKSSVYRGGPEFAMFGVGPYSFAPFKVAVSGLHRAPVFHAVGPAGGRPVMLDDTCYFVAARSPEQAALVAELLNGPEALGLLRALTLPGSKRAVTKALLQRLDLGALWRRADQTGLLARAGDAVTRTAGRPPAWPEPVERLLSPVATDGAPNEHPDTTEESPRPWPSPRSSTAAAR